MARVNGKAPPIFLKTNKPAVIEDCFHIINPVSIPVGTGVLVRMRSGERIYGELIDHSDWLVGCAVVKDADGLMIGIGYEGDIVEIITADKE